MAALRAQVQARYGFPDRALETLGQSSVSDALSVRILGAEIRAGSGDAAGASEALAAIEGLSVEEAWDVELRRSVLEGRLPAGAKGAARGADGIDAELEVVDVI